MPWYLALGQAKILPYVSCYCDKIIKDNSTHIKFRIIKGDGRMGMRGVKWMVVNNLLEVKND